MKKILVLSATAIITSSLSLTAVAEKSKITYEEESIDTLIDPISNSAEKSEITLEEEKIISELVAPISDSTERFTNYISELDQKYPDSAKVDATKFMEEHGEKLALLYCNAIGIDGPCALYKSKGNPSMSRFEAFSLEKKPLQKEALQKKPLKEGRWWGWVSNSYNVGVIPESKNNCSPGVPYIGTATPVSIHMDDEDRRNANSRSGWIGATSSGRNTTWNFCRLNQQDSLRFRPAIVNSEDYNYSVISFGLLCPSGSRRVIRYQENEMHRNQNSARGNVFPNFRQRLFGFKKLWVTYYCEYDSGYSNFPGSHYPIFPDLGFPYGVFANKNLPNVLARGSVSQDDEDWWNQNSWKGTPYGTMGGGRNTWRNIARVR